MKKITLYLKRFLLWIGAAGMLVAAAGCQTVSQDTSTIPMQKDVEQMIETANSPLLNGTITAPLVAQYAVTGHLTKELHPNDSELVIYVDADICAPEGDTIPIVHVVPNDFSQEISSRLFRYFCGDTPMYQIRTEEPLYSKADIDDNLSKLEEAYRVLCEKDSKDPYLENLQSAIQRQREAYDDAPEQIESIEADETLLAEDFYYGNATFGGVIHSINAVEYPGRAFEFGGKRFYLCNDRMLNEAITVTRDDGTQYIQQPEYLANMHYQDERYYTEHLIWDWKTVQQFVLSSTDLSAEALAQAKCTPEEAIAMTEQCFEELQLPFTVQETYYINMDEPCYLLYGVRQVNGIDCALTLGEAGGDGKPCWAYEYIRVIAGAHGIISFEWQSPCTVKETVVENAKLLPFSEIENVLDSMLPVIYGHVAESLGGLTLHIERIRLDFARIETTQAINDGILTPVWCFYGKGEPLQSNDNPGMVSDWERENRLLLSINAIDGSIISEDKGY